MADLKEWARLGAERRMQEIEAELAEIRKAFPGLGSRRRVQSGGGGGTLAHENEGGQAQGGKKKRNRTFSAAQRAEVSRRMKAYWAKRRKAKNA
jgi:hypothetical protein